MTITRYLQDDHVRLDQRIEDMRAELSARAFAKARTILLEIGGELSRHIDAEEQLLFPAFEQATRIMGGPTVVMRREHVELRRHLDTLLAALEAEAEAVARTTLDEFVALLGTHNSKEEHVLYPSTDRALSPQAAQDLLARIRAALGDAR